MAGSNGKQLFGQLIFSVRQVIVRYWQRVFSVADAQAYLGQALTEVNPINDDSSMVKQYSQPDLSAIFDTYLSYENIDLPLVLKNLSVIYNTGGAGGDYTEAAAISAAGSAWSVGSSVSGTAQASAFCIPELTFTLAQPPDGKLPVTNCFFFSTDISQANLLSILTAKLGATVLAWPIFKAQPLTLLLVGERVTASARRDYQGSASFNSSSSTVTLTQSDGLGTQFDHSPVVQVKQFPPCIHGAFTLSTPQTFSEDATTNVTVSGGVISGGGTSTSTATAAGSITPSSISATTPAAIPTSGLYLYDVSIGESTFYNNFAIHAKVFDFSIIA